MRRLYLLLLAVVSALVLTLSSCTPAPNFWREAKPGQKKILVSFPPLYCITHALAGDNAYVLCLLTSEGPHDHNDFSPTEMIKLDKANLFIFNGLQLDEAYADKMLGNCKNESLQKLNVGEVMLEKHPDVLLKGHEHVMADGSKHSHGDYDPHIWLGPREAMLMTRIIAAKLTEVDPANKKGYEDRADEFIRKLAALEEYGKNAFKSKQYRNIVTMHESLGYFARAFDLNIAGSIQVLPGIDPDAVTIKNLLELCDKKHVRVIAVEPQYSAAQAETLQTGLKSKGIEVGIVQIDPLETAPIPRGQIYNPDPNYYLVKMRENIDALARALP